jgi:hypothetical protein
MVTERANGGGGSGAGGREGTTPVEKGGGSGSRVIERAEGWNR